jgi:PAS domain S-box-containing protein
MPNDQDTNLFAELRKRAEALIKESGVATPPLDVGKTEQLIHELSSYQIELELQNEDLRHTQAELEEFRRRFSDLYDFAPVGYLTVNEQGLISEANLTAVNLLGVPRSLLLNRPLATYIVGDDHNIYYYFRQKLRDTMTRQTCELRLQKKDGPIFLGLLESTITPAVDGNSGQFRLVLTDISERKELEDNLRRSKEEWEKTFDTMSDFITTQDLDRRIIRANKAAHANYQVEPGGLNGKYCHEALLGSSQPCPNCPLPATISGKKINSAEIIKEDLGTIFAVTCAPLLDENGEIMQIVHIAKDITAAKKMAADLLQSRKMEAIGTLAGGIAHDFNNMLYIILGYAEMARDGLPTGSNVRDYLDEVLTAGNRAREVVKQILAFSRTNQPPQQPLQPAPIVNEVLKLVRALLPTTIEIHTEIAPDCGTIMANRTNLHQILLNLCTNAMQAMEDEKGVLTVGLTRVELAADTAINETDLAAGAFVELTVSDTGRGMAKADLERIFEPYFSTRDVGKGSGMGLAVVHGIVQGCGGFIKVESKPGRGSAFHVYFPAIAELEAEVTEAEPAPTGKERILVVDDEKSLAAMYQETLEILGYQVMASCSSVKALALFTADPESFDLLLTDQAMPEMSGVELATKILQLRPDIPVILCTGYSSIISAEKAKKIGIERFVMKPVKIRDLAVIIREVLDKKSAKQDGGTSHR